MTHIVIVDDDETAVSFMSAKLELAGISVTTFSDGATAVPEIVRLSPDMVLLDLAMPGLDGFEVLRQLKQEGTTNRIPVVVLSAYHSLEYVARAKELGAADFIIKPFLPEHFASHLRKIEFAKSADAIE